MNKEYIDREEAKTAIRERFKTIEERTEINTILNTISAADVRPVIHARWVSQLYAKYECSNCGFYEVPMPYNICPNCGADMREVNPDDQR